MADPSAAGVDDDVFDDESNQDTIRAKWSMDGASTLDEAAAKLEGYAASLRAMAADGWELTGTIDDDYGFIARK